MIRAYQAALAGLCSALAAPGCASPYELQARQHLESSPDRRGTEVATSTTTSAQRGEEYRGHLDHVQHDLPGDCEIMEWRDRPDGGVHSHGETISCPANAFFELGDCDPHNQSDSGIDHIASLSAIQSYLRSLTTNGSHGDVTVVGAVDSVPVREARRCAQVRFWGTRDRELANRNLSYARAQAVADYLSSADGGLPTWSVRIEGVGLAFAELPELGCGTDCQAARRVVFSIRVDEPSVHIDCDAGTGTGEIEGTLLCLESGEELYEATRGGLQHVARRDLRTSSDASLCVIPTEQPDAGVDANPAPTVIQCSADATMELALRVSITAITTIVDGGPDAHNR